MWINSPPSGDLIHHLDQIAFWRDAKKHEVDFILGDHLAYEVKTKKDSVSREKYSPFTTQYPTMPFSIIDTGDILQLFLSRSQEK